MPHPSALAFSPAESTVCGNHLSLQLQLHVFFFVAAGVGGGGAYSNFVHLETEHV